MIILIYNLKSLSPPSLRFKKQHSTTEKKMHYLPAWMFCWSCINRKNIYMLNILVCRSHINHRYAATVDLTNTAPMSTPTIPPNMGSRFAQSRNCRCTYIYIYCRTRSQCARVIHTTYCISRIYIVCECMCLYLVCGGKCFLCVWKNIHSHWRYLQQTHYCQFKNQAVSNTNKVNIYLWLAFRWWIKCGMMETSAGTRELKRELSQKCVKGTISW
jgi:hypothetical protein